MPLRRHLPAVALLTACALVGCGGKNADEQPKGAGGTPTAKESLEDLTRLLKDFEAKKQKPPAKIAAVEPVEPAFPGAYLGLLRGDIVYTWGAPLASDSQSVLAYEKKAPAEGGFVLLQNGTVKEMTAAEFAAAPKAK
jgi:hypothetical protein